MGSTITLLNGSRLYDLLSGTAAEATHHHPAAVIEGEGNRKKVWRRGKL